ncbi:ComEC/Rec2 family competence protein [Sphingomonas quercus]|nr:MBL fold metallo-hydrolase [Sphingomonas quercus]
MSATAGLVAMLASTTAPAAAPAGAPLRIIPVDVDGGTAVLYVTPQGHSLLIDAGWPSGMGGRATPGSPPPPSSAERIVKAAKEAGLSRIDYLLVTHYHVDHVGGVPDLIGMFPVDNIIDHGPNREGASPDLNERQLSYAPATIYPKYLAAIAGKPHRVMKPGDTLRIDDLVITAVDSDREILSKPLPGGGKPGWNCAAQTVDTRFVEEENPRSLGIVATWGKARILSLADTAWEIENKLVCPIDLIGPVDLMFADNHGTDNSGSPQLTNTVKPSVIIFGNGATKGGAGISLERAMASPRIKGMWQLHYATRSPDKNAPADQIANLADGPDAFHPLHIAVDKSGAITVTNPRNNFSKTYPKAN